MKRPNLLIIHTDQQALNTIGAYHGTEVETTYTDEIAKTGVTFEHFYTPSAVCTPSRGCLMTGRYPHCNGAFRNDECFNDDEITIAQMLKDEGYSTGYVGKWHLNGADSPGWVPEKDSKGFTDCKYMANGGHQKKVIDVGEEHPIFSYDIGDEKTYMTDWVCDRAVEFLDRQEDEKPFFLMIGIPDPHAPYKVRAPYDTMYPPEDVVVPETFWENPIPDWAESDTWGRHQALPMYLKDREQKFRQMKSQYLGEVKCIDDNIKKILDKLEAMGVREDTVLVFTSDHGDYMGEHGMLHKNNLYESAYHIPLIVSYPAKLKQGVRINKFVNIVDFVPTMLSLMEVKPCGREQGMDVTSLMYGETMDYEEEIYLHPNDVPRTGIITPDYELAYVGDGWKEGTVFSDHIMFDMKKDPLQVHNVFDDPAYQGIKEELTKKIIAHHKKYGTDFKVLPEVLWKYE